MNASPLDAAAPLAAWLAHAERQHQQSISLGLERVSEVWRRLGVPWRCRTFTVAGTNGKGSTCVLLEALLLAGGYRVATYLSPHIHNFCERLRMQGQAVASQALAPDFAAVEAARGQTPLTYFEFTTLAILHHIACSPVQVAVLEVGLGGRLDAVNVVDADCAIITSIDLDHQQYLGDTREAIGHEKAGIARAKRPLILGQSSTTESVLAHARQVGADVWRWGEDFRVEEFERQWNYRGRHHNRLALAWPALRGRMQLHNAALALAALESQSEALPLAASQVRQGLVQVTLPGRFQVLPGLPATVLDVAHNPQAARVLAENLDAHGFFARTYAVFGAMADKDIVGVVAPLMPIVTHWLPCALATPRAATLDQLKAALHQAGIAPDRVDAGFDNPQLALQAAHQRASSADRILCFGSFYVLAGLAEAIEITP